MVHVVAFKNEYATEVAALISQALQTANIRDYSHDQIVKLCDRFSPENIIRDAAWRHIFISIWDGRIVGTASIAKKPVRATNTHLLLGVFVHPRHHKQGIGRHLVCTLEDLAREWQIDSLMVASNISAKDFYIKMGYDYKDGIQTLNAKGHFVLVKNMDWHRRRAVDKQFPLIQPFPGR